MGKHLGSLIGTKIKEHRMTTSSAVSEHYSLMGHYIDPQKITILATEQQDLERKVKGAIEIREQKPTMNRDQGLDLPGVCGTLL